MIDKLELPDNQTAASKQNPASKQDVASDSSYELHELASSIDDNKAVNHEIVKQQPPNKDSELLAEPSVDQPYSFIIDEEQVYTDVYLNLQQYKNICGSLIANDVASKSQLAQASTHLDTLIELIHTNLDNKQEEIT